LFFARANLSQESGQPVAVFSGRGRGDKLTSAKIGLLLMKTQGKAGKKYGFWFWHGLC